MRWIVLALSHAATLAVGFALGVYFLPILTAPPGPDRAMIEKSSEAALYRASFTRDLKGSDFLHWGEGTVAVTPAKVVHDGALAPGPDYKLYLLPEFVDDEESFEKARARGVRVGDIKTFDGFIVDLPEGVDVNAYTTVVVWCESFSEFITAAKYR